MNAPDVCEYFYRKIYDSVRACPFQNFSRQQQNHVIPRTVRENGRQSFCQDYLPADEGHLLIMPARY
ncbi:MAG: hypothetical protein JW925_10595 [Syntrophaceae bacterium]|nr:hypothetical protein [Syntrophaceae bacterium]